MSLIAKENCIEDMDHCDCDATSKDEKPAALEELRNLVNPVRICRTKAIAYNDNRSMFNLVEIDLATVTSNFNVHISLGESKSVMLHLLNILRYLYTNKIPYENLTSSKVIFRHGVLKLADYPFDTPHYRRNGVDTLWYRAPELLLGSDNLSRTAMWSAGCIMSEMFTRTPIMQGANKQHQLSLITQMCGSFIPKGWPDAEELELYNNFCLPENQKRRVKMRLRPYVRDPLALDLLDKLLKLDPGKRIDAETALNHEFFHSEPMACNCAIS